TVDQAAAVDIGLLVYALEQPLIEPFLQQVELFAEAGHRPFRALAVVEREGEAPDLLTVVLAEIVHELDEAGRQIDLREQDINGEADAELVMQLADALLDGARMRLALRLLHGGEIVEADGDERAVDRLARPRALQQLQEAGPGSGIDGLMAVLGRVAAGGVDQHRFVGKPPVAIARAADAADGILAEFVGQREAQAGIDERRRLARARRP